MVRFKSSIRSWISIALLLVIGGCLLVWYQASRAPDMFTQRNIPQPFSIQSNFWHGGNWEATGIQQFDGKTLDVSADLTIDDKLVEEYSNDGDSISALLVIERFFDKDGRANAMNNEYYSTVLTPGGMPIEFSQGAFGAPSKYNVEEGLTFTTPIDDLRTQTIASIRDTEHRTLKPIHFSFHEPLAPYTPAGLYRPILYFFYTKQGTPQDTIASPENTLSLAHQILSPIIILCACATTWT